jgi:hypothetical protein
MQVIHESIAGLNDKIFKNMERRMVTALIFLSPLLSAWS